MRKVLPLSSGRESKQRRELEAVLYFETSSNLHRITGVKWDDVEVTFILEVPGSSLCRDTDYPDWVSWLSWVRPVKFRDRTSIRPSPLPWKCVPVGCSWTQYSKLCSEDTAEVVKSPPPPFQDIISFIVAVGISDLSYNVQFWAKMCIVIRLLPIVFSFVNYRLQVHVMSWTLRPRV
jgi:hypothetical protein